MPGTFLGPEPGLTALYPRYEVWSTNHGISSPWELLGKAESWASPQRMTQNLYLLIPGDLYPLKFLKHCSVGQVIYKAQCKTKM